jgi:trans-aconitate methyltransferase
VADLVISGQQAKLWKEIIGADGDFARRALVEPIVVSALEYFSASDSAARERQLGPQTPITKALQDSIHHWVSEANLSDWSARVTSGGLGLQKRHVLDLGCGEGYLGRWLSRAGVSYTGIEPSAELVVAAESHAPPDCSFVRATIEAFCGAQPRMSRPDLIVAIAVLEHCEDPGRTLRALHGFLQSRNWMDVPILVATLDQDFFTPGRSAAEKSKVNVKIDGHEWDPFWVASSAYWEFLFSDSRFHVLEQRPVHVPLLPNFISEKLVHTYYKQFGAGECRTAPRRGPFHFWVIRPRRIADECNGKLMVSVKNGEKVDSIGNLGWAIYTVSEGVISYTDRFIRPMEFSEGMTFGQYEVGRNYISSRILGNLVAIRDSTLGPCELISDINKKLELDGGNWIKPFFNDLLFYVTSQRFAGYIDAARANGKSRVLGVAPENRVRSYAASILSLLANAVNTDAHPILRFSASDYMHYVKGESERTGRGPDSQDSSVVLSFVQNGIVDCFNLRDIHSPARLLEMSTEELASGRYADVGLVAAIYIFDCMGIDVSHNHEMDLPHLAIAIADRLGLSLAPEERKWVSEDRTSVDKIIDDICVDIDGVDVDVNRIRAQINDFLSEVDLHIKVRKSGGESYSRNFGPIVVVHDVWALLSVVLDEPEMYRAPKPGYMEMNKYLESVSSGLAHRSRVIAYMRACVEHAGRSSGLHDFTIRTKCNEPRGQAVEQCCVM